MQDPFLRIISRYSEPSKLDTAEFMTLCQVGYPHEDFANHQFYIQLSKDADTPKWEKIGNFETPEILLNLIDALKFH